RAHHTEEPQPHGVEDEHRTAGPLDVAVADESDARGCEWSEQVLLVPQCHRRDVADEGVPEEAAAQPGRDGEEPKADHVEPRRTASEAPDSANAKTPARSRTRSRVG